MQTPSPETANYVYLLTTGLGLIVLVVLYAFGVWLRTYVYPSETEWPAKRQLLASIPVGFITMGFYAKSAFASLTLTSTNLVSDLSIMVGYSIIFGMLSRETLERLIASTQAPIAAPSVDNGASARQLD